MECPRRGCDPQRELHGIFVASGNRLHHQPNEADEPKMPKPSKNRGNNTLPGLEPELARLKRRFQSGQILELEWSPNNVPTSGEVTGGTIRIYEEDEARHKC